MRAIMLGPGKSVCDDELHTGTAAGKGGDAVECRATFEEVRGSQEGRGGEDEESEEQVSKWPRLTESNALLVIPSSRDPREAFPNKGAYYQREGQAADSGGRRPPQTYARVSWNSFAARCGSASSSECKRGG